LLKILNNSSDDYINNDYINDIINKSIKTKIKYIKDFKEKNIGKYSRAILNFGHTFGHAVESLNFNKGNIKHGEAVAIGMMFEIKISKLLNLKPISIVNLEGLLKKYNLPFDYRPYINNKNINNIMKKVYSDKKSFKDNTNLVLIKKNTGIVKNISLKKLKSITLELIK
jgi:3-dehydroquinate synthetase